MHSDIINDYLNKEVEVKITGGSSFSGTVKLFDEAKEVVVLAPQTSRYKTAKRYGDTVIRQHDIVSVREILPRIEEDFDDEEKMMKDIGDLSAIFDESDSDSTEDSSEAAYYKMGDKKAYLDTFKKSI
jgi:small nuclear ribonucleoprotein (snRNP)-like protein